MPPADLASSIYVRAAVGEMYGSKYGRISWRAAENGLFCLKGKSSSTF